MRLWVLILIVIVGASLGGQIVQAKEPVDPGRDVETELDRMHKKLMRGVINVGTSPLEMIKQTEKTINEQEPVSMPRKAVLLVPGLIRGVGHTVFRLMSGVWDIATFNVEAPKNYEPLIRPEYVYDEFGMKKVMVEE